MSSWKLREYIARCQAHAQKPTGTPKHIQSAPQKISTFAVATFLTLTAGFAPYQSVCASRKDEIPDRLFASQLPPEQIASTKVHDTKLIAPPMEETFFPTNFDGQARVINIDNTVNLTVAINQFYYNPKWRGEYWTPFDQVELVERATRLLSSFREYNEANQYKVLNKVNIFFERYSGFGP